MKNSAEVPPLSALTDRERDILRLLADGLSDSEIAEAAVLTVGTVKWYNRQIYSKLGVRGRAQAIATAQRLGMLGAQASRLPAAQPSHNLPAQVTTFIGRAREVGEVAEALARSRLVTLTGPPGTGKTRLALEAALSVLDRYHDGVFAVWLAPLQDAALVEHAVGQSLAVKAQSGETMADALKRALRDRQMLLFLDNFEHVLSAAPLISALLTAAPGLRVLVTSREGLRLYGEMEYPVPPMAVPDLRGPLPGAAHSEAVELFVQRAKAASPGFALNDENAAAVATICVHLDGLPLAIELAAARCKYYAPQTLLLRLGSRLEALDTGPRDVPARQRTLRKTLAWSYDLLDTTEQALFARLGIFAGGCTPDDAAAICGDGLSIDVGEGLESLYGKSLLRLERGADGEPRFVMLETMREFALEKLAERGEADDLRERHAMHFVTLAETARQMWRGPHEAEWLARLEARHDDLRAALQWSLSADDPRQISLRLIVGTAGLWEVRGHFSEGHAWLREALKLQHNAAPSILRADALRGISRLTHLQCDYAVTRRLNEEAFAIYDALGASALAADVLITLGAVAADVGDYDTAISLFRDGEAIMAAHGRISDKARSATQLGCGLLRQGDLAGAVQWLATGRDRYRAAGFLAGEATAAAGLGEAALRAGDLDAAMPLLEYSLSLRRQVVQPWGVAASLGGLAWAALLRGDTARALDHLRESLSIRIDIGDKGGMAWCAEKLAAIAHAGADDGDAARLLGAASALRASVNSVIDPVDRPDYDRLLAGVRAALDPDVFGALWNEGRSMTTEQLLAAAAAR